MQYATSQLNSITWRKITMFPKLEFGGKVSERGKTKHGGSSTPFTNTKFWRRIMSHFLTCKSSRDTRNFYREYVVERDPRTGASKLCNQQTRLRGYPYRMHNVGYCLRHHCHRIRRSSRTNSHIDRLQNTTTRIINKNFGGINPETYVYRRHSSRLREYISLYI